MQIFHIDKVAEDVLAHIIVDEISNNENDTLTFRGNTIATKAMEAFMKLVGEKYLEEILNEILINILHSDIDLEVDPVKVKDNVMLTSQDSKRRWPRRTRECSDQSSNRTTGLFCTVG